MMELVEVESIDGLDRTRRSSRKWYAFIKRLDFFLLQGTWWTDLDMLVSDGFVTILCVDLRI